MNSNGLLAKVALDTQSILTPTFVYQTPNNGYITLLDIYIAADPSLVTDITLYVSKQITAPNNDDAIIVNKPLNGTIVLNNIEATYNESIFVTATNTSGSGTVTVQVRGRTQIVPPGLLIAEATR